MDTMLKLHVTRGPIAGEEFCIAASDSCSCVIGRSQDCDVVLPDAPAARTASRRHCRVEQTLAGPVVRDLGSRNGTYLNGIRIGHRPTNIGPLGWPFAGAGHLLADGDKLRVGDTVFQVIVAGAVTETAEAKKLCDAVH
jgi:pSer/pThr/pTyr-binding forkhead associated (FHA) protein